MSDAGDILALVRDAAAKQLDLGEELRRCGIPGAERVAERMAAGESAATALSGILPARLSRLLAGAGPPFPVTCALVADEERRRSDRRRLLADALAYPCASLAVVIALMAGIRWWIPHVQGYGELVSMRLCLVPALALLVLCAAPLIVSWRLPGSGWRRHLDLAQRWARAALSVEWRLTELQARLVLGIDLTLCGDVLGAPSAVDHCRQLADWHLRAARRQLAVTAWCAAALVMILGGAVVLGSIRFWTGMHS